MGKYVEDLESFGYESGYLLLVLVDVLGLAFALHGRLGMQNY